MNTQYNPLRSLTSSVGTHTLYKAVLAIFVIAVLTVFLSSCDQQTYGFALPKGDADEGKKTFIQLNCNDCHSVEDIQWKGNQEDLHIEIGGEVARVRSYGQLVTSIINPSHRLASGYPKDTVSVDGVSKMRKYNEVMTVQELIDLVSYLEGTYDIKIPSNYTYPY